MRPGAWLLLWWLIWGGVAAASPAPPTGAGGGVGGVVVVRSADGRAPAVPERTYRWHGLNVPAGACGAVVHGRSMVLPCRDARVVTYRRVLAGRRRLATAAAIGGLVVAGGVALGGRRRTPGEVRVR